MIQILIKDDTTQITMVRSKIMISDFFIAIKYAMTFTVVDLTYIMCIAEMYITFSDFEVLFHSS